jgi:hypothetical protein
MLALPVLSTSVSAFQPSPALLIVSCQKRLQLWSLEASEVGDVRSVSDELR